MTFPTFLHFRPLKLRIALGIWVALLSAPCAIAESFDDIDWQPGQVYNPRALVSTPHEDIRKLLRREKFEPALKRVEKELERNPRDPQMRFWQGFLLERTGKPEMALPIYLDLTREYPELAEPHNNLGVIYAAQGDYENAKASLDAALRANPHDAIAQENMGDILVHLSRLSYERSLKINPKQASLKKKLERLQPVLDLTQGKP